MPPVNRDLRIDTSANALTDPSSSRQASASTASLSHASARSFRPRSTSSASASSSISSVARSYPSRPSTSHSTRRARTPAECPSDDDGPSVQEYVLAMHDFAPQSQNVTCLAFTAGQVIRVINRDSSGWWDGELDGRRGWFPSNYVTSDVGLLTEEELPKVTHARSGHTHSISATSAASWSTPMAAPSARNQSFSRTDHRPIPSDSGGQNTDTYCPPLMVPLLHGLSLLQNAAKMNRTAHFQPSTAYIISCVRAILSDVGCLSRDAPILKLHGILAQERKRILSDLASLVSQAKRASDENLSEDLKELEIETMVKLGGQLFAHVRGFLTLLVQCGVPLPKHGGRPPGSAFGIPSSEQWTSSDGTAVQFDEPSDPGEFGQCWAATSKTTNGIEHRISARKFAIHPTVHTPLRARSMGDLRTPKQIVLDADVRQMPLKPHLKTLVGQGATHHSFTPRTKRLIEGAIAHHKTNHSFSSSHSSSSSFSSGESIGTPATPVFPSGPSTTSEVMEALRYTHDHYLSTIAAFIGHAHSHSRSSHASSTGHMYDLVREVVDMVCKLLTIVEAVLKHPDIPAPKAQTLKSAKEGLYHVTSKLADSVRVLTMSSPSDVTEEEEKATLLRCATNALKAGSDCVSAVKKCLQRPIGEKALIVQLPPLGEFNMPNSPRKFSYHTSTHSRTPSKTSSFHGLRHLYASIDANADEEDLTIQAQTVSSVDVTVRVDRSSSDSMQKVDMPNPWQLPKVHVETEAVDGADDTAATHHSLPPLRIPTEPVAPDLPSPASIAQTDDDRTTWEGSQRRPHSPMSFEEKLLHGNLPAVPGSSLSESARTTPVAWTLSHDHAPDDVAYNSDGQLVGATLAALVERMTPHDAVVEQAFAAVFFLTFRLFTTPMNLVEAIIARYNLSPPLSLSVEDQYVWQQRKGLPVRLRVSNFVKAWLESHWRPATDNIVLQTLLDFTRDALATMFPVPSQRILELIGSWQTMNEASGNLKMERGRDISVSLNPPVMHPSEVPRPVMTKALLNALRSKNFGAISVTDFDCLELARQLTTMECILYCAIRPEEVLETGQDGVASPVNIKAVTSLSTAITGYVAESILNELDTKKRTALVKFFIKVADRCVSLNNFSTPRSILAALDSSTISRLQQTWTGLPQKNKLQLEALRKLADHARNYHEYRTRLRNTSPPAVPFLGLYLTDVTFCREGNPSHRASPKSPDKRLLNFNKYHKLTRIVQDMQRFQVPYNLKQIPEVQEYLKDAFEKSKHRGDLHDLYRRSLLVEPKQPADTPPASDVRQLFNWTNRSQSHHTTPTSAS
ncbi:uncharacterized protein FIBRA_01282 [Fibroporia radiculosa]|uniref:Ras GEF n=1 Tax=Fibroporia radiculosa TaxID=599839 RepID=J4HT24_9APHY|nr:uncharacterized protein FIBRA_01282 [Fibroporia radiculosa]CCL99267.1 predicted protein [Fibroporia radiculosa]